MIIDIEEVKAVIGIKDNSKDERITALLPFIYDELENYVGWTDLTVIKMIEYHLNYKPGLSSEGLSRHSSSFDTEYPKSITKGLRRKL